MQAEEMVINLIDRGNNEYAASRWMHPMIELILVKIHKKTIPKQWLCRRLCISMFHEMQQALSIRRK